MGVEDRGGSGSSRGLGLDAYVYVVLMVALGSTTAAAAKIATREWPLALLPFVRYGISGLCLLPFVRDRGAFGRMFRQDWPLVLLGAALCVPVNQAFFLSASRLGPTSHVGIFYATAPLIVLVVAWLTRMERPDLGRLWGVLASVGGIAVIGLGNLWAVGGTPAAEVRSVVTADLLLIGAVVSWGVYLAISKPLVERHGAIPALAGTFLLGSLLCAPMAAWTFPSWPPFSHYSSTAWFTLVFLGVFITPVSQACQNLAMRLMDASQVANFSNASPLLTVVWGIWLFSEPLTLYLVLGGLLTMGGIVWTGWPRGVDATDDEAIGQAIPEPSFWRGGQVDEVPLGKVLS